MRFGFETVDQHVYKQLRFDILRERLCGGTCAAQVSFFYEFVIRLVFSVFLRYVFMCLCQKTSNDFFTPCACLQRSIVFFLVSLC